ncbi:MAG: tRNA (adenosine(37)-N6)-dimethylallyltransferase MiaA, partial [Clostridia bacterium]|nr:tRNA (adenosine(37)-N6)-dimethylallyltransferase MiaA [Clostridia bacterium]
AIDGIISRGKLPVLCGGTGLYVDNIIYGTSFSPDVSPDIRAELEKIGNDELYEMLVECDPETAAAVHKNNRKRVIRALEIFRGTGIPKSEWDRRSRLSGGKYDPVIIGLRYEDRELLYSRINERVDRMITEGLEEEVRALYGRLSATASQAIGYKQMIDHFEGRMSLEEAVDEIKKATRRYAKRQMTWFCRNESIRWITLTGKENIKDIVNNAENLLTNNN